MRSGPRALALDYGADLGSVAQWGLLKGVACVDLEKRQISHQRGAV